MTTDRLCYLNGAYKPLSQAQVSVLDRGFLSLCGFGELLKDGIVLVFQAGLADVGYESRLRVKLVERDGGVGFHFLNLHSA